MVTKASNLRFEGSVLRGKIYLDGSKSISNRALILAALSGSDASILEHLSTSVDSHLMQSLLKSDEYILDTGAAGTTYRFLTAYLSIQKKERILTGSDRMKQRPIGELVAALNSLGAHIEYIDKEGFPPLKILAAPSSAFRSKVTIRSTISSQYISALLMIGPYLPQGLELRMTGDTVSLPYIEMTLAMIKHFGVHASWEGDIISLAPQMYIPKPLFVEGDWSAASYYYAMASLINEVELELHGISANSLQGDSAIAEIGNLFNIHTRFESDHIVLTKNSKLLPASIEWDFVRCPDLAQTVIAMCAGTGLKGIFTGLQTLRIKETDRISAMSSELKKIGVDFGPVIGKTKSNKSPEYFKVEGKANFTNTPSFATYDDHRMAMALAPLAILHPIKIEDPEVVVKSYGNYWQDLRKLGFIIN